MNGKGERKAAKAQLVREAALRRNLHPIRIPYKVSIDCHSTFTHAHFGPNISDLTKDSELVAQCS